MPKKITLPTWGPKTREELEASEAEHRKMIEAKTGIPTRTAGANAARLLKGQRRRNRTYKKRDKVRFG